jgi:hypothetical protein
MTEFEILGDRIEKVKRRYKKAVEQAISVLSWENEKLDRKDFYEAGSLSGLADLIKLTGELNSLLFLKDKIENQARETKTVNID